MDTVKKHNQGFSLIELLIAITILSIVMVMVVQFMSTTSGAYQKNKKNLNLQSDSMQIMEQISDTLMQARYIRVQTKDKGMYTITRSYVDSRPRRDVAESVAGTNTDDFVPDSYGNYAKLSTFETTDRKVIVDYSNYQILDEASGDTYPLSTDKDYSSSTVASFRKLKQGNVYQYVKPEFIYVEYPTTIVSSGVTVEQTEHVMYHITGKVDDIDNTCAIYMIRYKTDPTYGDHGFEHAKSLITNNLTASANHDKENANDDVFTAISEDDTVRHNLKVQKSDGGLITNNLFDFYLSADSEGNAVLFDVTFKNGGYEYNCVDTVICRNSNVLTVRPQKLFKKKGTSEVVPAGGGSGGSEGAGESGGAGESSGGESTPESE